MVLTAIFFSLFFNRFAGLRSGDGEFGGGYILMHGSMPFRDYFTASPPLNQFKSGILLSLFGEKLIVSRTAGLVERSLIALILYLWLLRFCRPAHAAIAAFATLVVSSCRFYRSGSLVQPRLYILRNHKRLSGKFCSGSKSIRSLLRLVKSRRRFGRRAQSAYIANHRPGRSGRRSDRCCCNRMADADVSTRHHLVDWFRLSGRALPVVALLIWIASLGSLKKFLVAIFIKGPAAKAQHGGGDFITRAIHVGNLAARPMSLAILQHLSLYGSSLRSERSRSEQNIEGPTWEMPAVAAFGIISIALGSAFHIPSLGTGAQFLAREHDLPYPRCPHRPSHHRHLATRQGVVRASAVRRSISWPRSLSTSPSCCRSRIRCLPRCCCRASASSLPGRSQVAAASDDSPFMRSDARLR